MKDPRVRPYRPLPCYHAEGVVPPYLESWGRLVPYVSSLPPSTSTRASIQRLPPPWYPSQLPSLHYVTAWHQALARPVSTVFVRREPSNAEKSDSRTLSMILCLSSTESTAKWHRGGAAPSTHQPRAAGQAQIRHPFHTSAKPPERDSSDLDHT